MTRLSIAAALAATALALAASAGCKKDEEKKAEPAAEPKPADPAATAPITAAAPTATPAPGAAAPAAAKPAAADPGVKPASVTDDQLKVAEKIVAATNSFADALDAVKSDCKKATATVKSEGKKIKSSMDETQKLQEQLRADPVAMQWFQKTYGPKMMGALGKLGGVVNACRQDKDFEAAFKSLDLGGKPRPAPGSAPPAGAPPPGSSRTAPGSHGMGGMAPLPTDSIEQAPRPN